MNFTRVFPVSNFAGIYVLTTSPFLINTLLYYLTHSSPCSSDSGCICAGAWDYSGPGVKRSRTDDYSGGLSRLCQSLRQFRETVMCV